MEGKRIPEKVEEFIRKEVEMQGFELVDIVTRGGGGFFFEVILDKTGGVTLEDCGNFNRMLSAWIDKESMFRGRYTLDVCSPGLDRPLKSDKDYLWAVGRQIVVHLQSPVNSKTVLSGKLKTVNGAEDITMENEDGSEICVERCNITKANLWASI